MTGTRWNFSLKQFLLACGCVSAGVGMITVASQRAVGELAVPGAILLGLGVGILVQRPRLVCGLFALAAVASFGTSGILWDGGTDPYQLELTVVDPGGKPIDGASVTPRLDGKAITDRFFHKCSEPPTTGRFGIVSCLVAPHRFGGKAWFLFWCIPIPNHPPHYVYRVVVEVEHPEYEPVRLRASDLLRDVESLDYYETIGIEYHGDLWKIPVFPLKVEMEPR